MASQQIDKIISGHKIRLLVSEKINRNVRVYIYIIVFCETVLDGNPVICGLGANSRFLG